MDWRKAKQEYITDPDSSYRRIADKYGISRQQLFRRAKKENWVELKKQHESKVLTKTTEKIAEKESDFVSKQMARIDQAVSIAIGKAIDALVEIDPQDTQRHRQLVQNLKDLKDMLQNDNIVQKQEIMIQMSDEAKGWSK